MTDAHAISVTVSETGEGLYTQTISDGRHAWAGDEPASMGGRDAGPSPYELLLSALGACTSITLRMYANQKKWDVTRISVALTHVKENRADVITRTITLEGNLDDAQRQRMLEIADKCPVHRTLSEDPRPAITSVLA